MLLRVLTKSSYWKNYRKSDVGIRLEGEAVNQLTSIFLSDYELNVKTPVEEFEPYFCKNDSVKQG